MRAFREEAGGTPLDEPAIYQRLVAVFKGFAPEAKGVRAHSLYYDSMLLPTYQEFGLEYDSTYQIPLIGGLRPFWKENEILEIPVYFNDHFELKSNAVGFDARNLKLGEDGLKVILLHPNIMFLNANSNKQYLACKPFYHDYERLLEARNPGRGVRSLALDLLDSIVAQKLPLLTLGEVSERWRHMRKWR
jgi:hypothetical protein